MAHIACGDWNIRVGAASSHKFPTYSPGDATLIDFTNCTPGAKSRIASFYKSGQWNFIDVDADVA